MARYNKKSYGKKKYGKPFRKKSSRGKFKKGTMIRYVYKGRKRIGAVRANKSRRY